MARVAGVNISDRKHTVIALTEIYGIGDRRAQMICDSSGIDRTILVKNLSEAELEKLRNEVTKFNQTHNSAENEFLMISNMKIMSIYLQN